MFKEKIDLSHSDTTWEINNKSRHHFDRESLLAMREIYLQVRYGDKPSKKDTAQKTRRLLKRLAQGTNGGKHGGGSPAD